MEGWEGSVRGVWRACVLWRGDKGQVGRGSKGKASPGGGPGPADL